MKDWKDYYGKWNRWYQNPNRHYMPLETVQLRVEREAKGEPWRVSMNVAEALVIAEKGYAFKTLREAQAECIRWAIDVLASDLAALTLLRSRS